LLVSGADANGRDADGVGVVGDLFDSLRWLGAHATE